MKTTKHIESLANKWFEYNLKNFSYYTESDREYSVRSFKRQLNNIKNAMLKGTFYAGVESVSASGMSRIIKLAYIKNNRLNHINQDFLLKLAACDKNGRISGCGMDMLFHAQYTLFHNLHSDYKKAHYQKRMKQYNNL